MLLATTALSLGETIAIVLPLAGIELGLLAWALVDLARRDHVRGGSKILWLIVVLLIGTIGPIVYLAWGRTEA